MANECISTERPSHRLRPGSQRCSRSLISPQVFHQPLLHPINAPVIVSLDLSLPRPAPPIVHIGAIPFHIPHFDPANAWRSFQPPPSAQLPAETLHFFGIFLAQNRQAQPQRSCDSFCLLPPLRPCLPIRQVSYTHWLLFQRSL